MLRRTAVGFAAAAALLLSVANAAAAPTERLILFVTPRVAQPTWRIRMARNLQGRGWRLVAIARAWR